VWPIDEAILHTGRSAKAMFPLPFSPSLDEFLDNGTAG
jgi:hypothetical protein